MKKTKYNKYSKKYLIGKKNEILSNFNFEKVHSFMEMSQWKWCYEKKFDIPPVEEIKKMADSLINTLIYENQKYCASGGLEASLVDGKLSLKFVTEPIVFRKRIIIEKIIVEKYSNENKTKCLGDILEEF